MDMRATEMKHAERMEFLKKLASEAGLRLPTTILPEGHALWEVGARAQRKMEQDIAKLPDLHRALHALQKRIETERHLDVKGIKPGELWMNETGHLPVLLGNEPQSLAFDMRGFGQVCERIKPPDMHNNPAQFLRAIKDPALRADTFNHFAQETAKYAGTQDPVVLRTMVEPVSARRLIRAVTSEKHSLATGDDAVVAESLRVNLNDRLFNSAKGRITRWDSGTSFEIIWPAFQYQIAVGDICIVGVRIENSETRQGALRVSCFVLRVLCANFTTAYSQDDGETVIDLRHVGNLKSRIGQAVANAIHRAEPFVKAFGDAYKDALPAFAPTRGEVLERVQSRFKLPAAFVENVAELWDADGLKSAGDTRGGLVNAMTRASQELPEDKASDMEGVAGRIAVDGWSLFK